MPTLSFVPLQTGRLQTLCQFPVVAGDSVSLHCGTIGSPTPSVDLPGGISNNTMVDVRGLAGNGETGERLHWNNAFTRRSFNIPISNNNPLVVGLAILNQATSARNYGLRCNLVCRRHTANLNTFNPLL